MNNFIIGLSSLFTFFLSYKFYYYSKRKVYEYIMEKVKEELDSRMKEEDEMFKPFQKNSSAILKFSQGGKTHSIYVPYDRRKSSTMLRKKFFLIKDGEKIEINQKPGIPYLVSAGTLGGEKIIVEDSEGNTVKIFGKEEIPNF